MTMTTSDDDEIHIDITPAEFRQTALDDLSGFDQMLNDPLMTEMLGSEMVEGIRKVNDEKIAQIKEIPDE